jgi:SNF2 family DNA or RNA helicase
VTVTPFPFQAELVERLGNPDIKARLIGDEQGLGKTYEAIWIDQRLRAPYNQNTLWRQRKMRTLIIAPFSVHEAWARAINQETGATDIVVINRKKRHLFTEALARSQARYFICHYEALILQDMASVRRVQWFHVVADEIHRIKSEKSKQRRAVRMLHTLYKTGMSGTLADDKPQDFWSPLNWAAPELFPSAKAFRDRYCETEQVQGRFLGLDAEGEPMHQMYQVVTGIRKDQVAPFHDTIRPFYMRRLKKDVGIDLPEKYYSIVNVALPPKQRKVYDDLRKKGLAWIGEHEHEKLSAPHAFSRLVRLQQAALATLEWGPDGIDPRTGELIRKVTLIEPSAKLDALVDWMKDRSDQLIIFSQSASMIGLVAARLGREGLKVGMYTGKTSPGYRQELVDLFQAGELDVFASTIKAGGESITLTAASTVVFLDRAWGPHRNEQAEDRAHRIGQTKPVQIVDFYAPNTVDSKVRNTNILKWSVLKTLMGDQVV